MEEKPPMYPGLDNQGQPPAPYPTSQQPYPPAQQPYPTTQQPQPQAAYPQSGQTTVVVTQPAAVVVGAHLGDNPVRMQCPNCRADITTNVIKDSGLLTWLLVGGLCIIGYDVIVLC